MWHVFIMDDCEDLIPEFSTSSTALLTPRIYHSTSHETLQQHRNLKVIRKNLVKKALDEVSEDKDNFNHKFYEAFSKNIKLGIHKGTQNRSKLAEF